MRLKGAENEIESERKELKEAEEDIGEEEEDAWYLRRLEGGLFTLQSVDYILGWICMEDDGVRFFLHSRTSPAIANLQK
jgi:beta-catenin-like protein 1